MDSTPELRGVWLGRSDFAGALAMQEAARDEVVAGASPVLFVVEHPPVLTLGRRASPADILWSPEQLAAAGVTVVDTPRGGEVTLHAPGQLVCYPVVHVGRKIREHIVRLGRVATTLLAELGLSGHEFRMAQPGVWLGERKLASIGVHISRGVAIQGMSINLDVAPDLFGALVSCGLHGVEVTSAAAVGGRKLPIAAAARRFAELFAADLGHTLRWQGPAPIG